MIRRALIATTAGIVGLLLLLAWPWLVRDYGQCLQSHRQHRHQDAYISFACDAEGICIPEWHGDEDWDVTICDQWEFPHGRMEKD